MHQHLRTLLECLIGRHGPIRRHCQQEEIIIGLIPKFTTRGDLEKLRAEILNGFVQSSALEPRLEAIRQELTRVRGDMEELEKKEISERDRRWIRAGQLFGYLAFAISILTFLLQHVHIT